MRNRCRTSILQSTVRFHVALDKSRWLLHKVFPMDR